MLSTIIEYLKKKNWSFIEGKIPGMLTLNLSGVNGIFHTLIDVNEKQNRFVVITYWGINCPIAKRTELAVLINKINATIMYGNFEMNENGDIKFRTGLLYDGVELDEKLIEQVLLSNLATLDIAAPFLSQFMFGALDVNETYLQIFPPQAELIEPEN